MRITQSGSPASPLPAARPPSAAQPPSGCSVHAVLSSRRTRRPCELGLHLGVLDRGGDLDPVIEVPRHQVGAAQERLGPLARLEEVEAAVLEEATEDAADADRLGQPGDAGPQGADRAGDDVDLGAGLRGRVELLDDRLVGERVRLQPDARVLSVPAALRRSGSVDKPTRRLTAATGSCERCGSRSRHVVEEVGTSAAISSSAVKSRSPIERAVKRGSSGCPGHVATQALA